MSLLVRWLHVLAAITWIGGMLFIALVLVPAARRLEDPTLRTRLIHDTGRRFRTVGWTAIGVLVVTGLLNLWMHPVLLSSSRFPGKVGLVVLALILSAFHDFVLVLGAGAGVLDRPGQRPGRAGHRRARPLALQVAGSDFSSSRITASSRREVSRTYS